MSKIYKISKTNKKHNERAPKLKPVQAKKTRKEKNKQNICILYYYFEIERVNISKDENV